MYRCKFGLIKRSVKGTGKYCWDNLWKANLASLKLPAGITTKGNLVTPFSFLIKLSNTDVYLQESFLVTILMIKIFFILASRPFYFSLWGFLITDWALPDPPSLIISAFKIPPVKLGLLFAFTTHNFRHFSHHHLYNLNPFLINVWITWLRSFLRIRMTICLYLEPSRWE